VVLDGCPPNIEITEEEIQKDLDEETGQSAITNSAKKNRTRSISFQELLMEKQQEHRFCLWHTTRMSDLKDYDTLKTGISPGACRF